MCGKVCGEFSVTSPLDSVVWTGRALSPARRTTNNRRSQTMLAVAREKQRGSSSKECATPHAHHSLPILRHICPTQSLFYSLSLSNQSTRQPWTLKKKSVSTWYVREKCHTSVSTMPTCLPIRLFCGVLSCSPQSKISRGLSLSLNFFFVFILSLVELIVIGQQGR